MVKNTAGQKIGAQMVSATDGSAFTGAVTVAVTVDAGTQATGSVGSGACAHEGNGYHTYAPAQAETNGTLIAFTFTGTGAVPATVQVFTTGYDPTAAQIPANVTQISGDSTAADNLEAAADGTGYNLGGGSVVAASVTGNVGGNVTGSVGSVAAGGITASSLAADAITAAKLAADVSAEIADAVWEEALADHEGTVGSTAEALATAGGSGASAADIADAVWDEATAGHVTAGSFGKAAADILEDTAEIGAAGAGLTALATQASVNTIDDFLDTEIAAIKAKTDNLPTDPADASDIAASFSSVTTTLSTIAGYLDTEIAAIKAKTDNLPTDPADASDIAASFTTISSTLTTMAAYIDTEVAAIKAKTDKLTFDADNALDANVQKINDVTLLGDGDAVPWGPA
jgi:hypothetical protein